MLTPGNIDALFYGIRETRAVPGRIVEIGCFCGLSSNLITFLKLHTGNTKPLISMDPWEYGPGRATGAEISPGQGVTWTEYTSFVRSAYRDRVGFFSRNDLPFAIQGYSGDIFELWRENACVDDVFGRSVSLGGEISFAFVDGDHSYEGARHDFECIDEYLTVGGCILFDDSGQGGSRGCERAAKEAASRKNYLLISANPNLLIKKLAPG